MAVSSLAGALFSAAGGGALSCGGDSAAGVASGSGAGSPAAGVSTAGSEEGEGVTWAMSSVSPPFSRVRMTSEMRISSSACTERMRASSR